MSKKIFRKLKDKSPTILCVLAAGGVVSTVIFAVKATPKAMKKCEERSIKKLADGEGMILTKKEIFCEVWKDYLPAAAMGVGTIICIFGANILNRRNQAMLTSAYAVLNNQFSRYSDEVRRRFGSEVHEEIVNDIRETNAPVEVARARKIDFDPSDENELLFYDTISKRYFKSTGVQVLTALIDLNRSFCEGGDPEVNMYYDFLGLEGVEHGDNIGWSLDDGLYWIDFEIFKATADDDTLEYYVLNPIFWPEPFQTE